MSKSRSIPEELIKVKAQKIWEKRLLKGRDGTPESDWEEARQYLEKHWWVIFLWKVNTPVRSLRNFWSLFGDPQSRDFALEVVKTLGIGLTAFGLLFSVWEGIEDRKETWENRILTQKQLDTAQERLVTERFSKAVEQLGKDKDTTVRIGGIYALERIAKYYDKDHWTIMEVLTSYVRENSPVTKELKNTIKEIQNLINSYKKQEINYTEFKQREQELIEQIKIKIDVQTVLTVIARRKDPEPNRNERIDLSATNLNGADLNGADLNGAHLNGAHLEYADLEYANLYNTNLRNAHLRSADLYNANLRNAHLRSADLYNANLEYADLEYANLEYADLEYADLYNANLEYADLEYADLEYADLYNANLEYADLYNADLEYANLEYANLEGAYLIDAQNLTKTQIKSACFWDKAIYKGEWDWEEETETWVANNEQAKQDNTNFIEELKKDKSSDPKEKPDCSYWSK